MNRRSVLALALFFIVMSSCRDSLNKTVEVYNNDFEGDNLANITGGVIESYNGSKVLGRYNNGSFKLTLNNLPKHQLISVSFYLYINDSWDGNAQAIYGGPDIWEMLVDGDQYIYTSFSNSPCTSGCVPQSYPYTYPNNFNNPKTGASRVDLPPACKPTYPNGTSLYLITKTFKHSGPSITIQCADKLVQPNDGLDHKCDESWAVDNLNVKAITP